MHAASCADRNRVNCCTKPAAKQTFGLYKNGCVPSSGTFYFHHAALLAAPMAAEAALTFKQPIVFSRVAARLALFFPHFSN